MKSYSKYILLGAVLIIASMFLGCSSEDENSEENENQQEPDNTIVVNGVEAYSTELDKPRQKVTATKAIFYETTQELHMQDVAVEFKPETMTTCTLTAKNGILYMVDAPDKNIRKNDVLLQGAVTFTNPDGLKVIGSNFYWNNENGLSSKDKFERVIPMGKQLGLFSGNGFKVNAQFTEWTDYGAKVNFNQDGTGKNIFTKAPKPRKPKTDDKKDTSGNEGKSVKSDSKDKNAGASKTSSVSTKNKGTEKVKKESDKKDSTDKNKKTTKISITGSNKKETKKK